VKVAASCKKVVTQGKAVIIATAASYQQDMIYLAEATAMIE